MAPYNHVDYFWQTLENVRFFSREDAEVFIITAKDALGKYKAIVVREEGKHREALFSESGASVSEALRALHVKSAEAVQNHISTYGFDFVRDLKKRSGKKKGAASGHDHDDESDLSDSAESSTLALSDIVSHDSLSDGEDDDDDDKSSVASEEPKKGKSGRSSKSSSGNGKPNKAVRRTRSRSRSRSPSCSRSRSPSPRPRGAAASRGGPDEPGRDGRTRTRAVAKSADRPMGFMPPVSYKYSMPPPPPSQTWGPMPPPPVPGMRFPAPHMTLPAPPPGMTGMPGVPGVPGVPGGPKCAPSPTPVIQTELRDVRLHIVWKGHGDVRVFERSAPSHRALLDTALSYVRTHVPIFANITPLDSTAGRLWSLKATLRQAFFGQESYDMSNYASEDLTRLFDVVGEKDIPLFEVEVSSGRPGPGPPGPVMISGPPARNP